MNVGMYVCMKLYIYIYIYIYIFRCVESYVYWYVCVCIYISLFTSNTISGDWNDFVHEINGKSRCVSCEAETLVW